MFGLIYLIFLVGTVAVAIDGFSSFTRKFEEKEDWPVNFVIFAVASAPISFFAFLFALSLFSGSTIYGFSLVFYVIPISFGVLMATSFALKRLSGKFVVLAYSCRLAVLYLVPYIFMFLEPARKWLSIKTTV